LTYVVTVVQAMDDSDIITVTPINIELPYPAQTPASKTLSVTAKKKAMPGCATMMKMMVTPAQILTGRASSVCLPTLRRVKLSG
jgi:hypothetical protein